MNQSRDERGTSIIEVLMASLILTTGLLAVAMTLGAGVSSMFIAQEELVAKQKAREALESVFTARNTQNIIFDQIRNVSDGGIFMNGYKPVVEMGIDGLVNTADDVNEPVEKIVLAGKDLQLGTTDDETRWLTAFQRQITITDVLLQNGNVDPDIRQIAVEVRFQNRGVWRTVRVNSYISKFS